jgi:hypothetical protein
MKSLCLSVSINYAGILFDWNFEFIPFGFADELGQVTTIIGLGTKPMTHLSVLGVEGRLLDFGFIDFDLLPGFYIVKLYARHGITPLQCG